MRYFLVMLLLVSAVGCGGGGDGGADLSCAPSELSEPTVDLDGSWTLDLTETSSTCTYPPNWIDCNLNFSVSGNDVSITGTCDSSAGVTVDIGNTSGKVSNDTLYWGATMTATVDTYTETGTVSCKAVDFTSNTQSETFSVTVDVEWSDSETHQSDSCSTTFSGVFTSA